MILIGYHSTGGYKLFDPAKKEGYDQSRRHCQRNQGTAAACNRLHKSCNKSCQNGLPDPKRLGPDRPRVF